MIGGVIMTHGDDGGLILPPRVAPYQVVIIPIPRGNWKETIVPKAREIRDQLVGRGIRVMIDDRDSQTPGWKYNEWEMRGVPLRMEIGPKDLDKNQAMLVRRDTGEKGPVSLDTIGEDVSDLLARIQLDMLATARDRLDRNSIRGAIDYNRFKEVMEGEGAFVYAGWCGDPACETRIKEETKATIRVLPDEEFRSAEAPARCLLCNRPAKEEAVWAKSY
jgi:prolyl-tRNA synthetase